MAGDRAGPRPLQNLSLTKLNALKRTKDLNTDVGKSPSELELEPNPPIINLPSETEQLFLQYLRHASNRLLPTEGHELTRIKRSYTRETKLRAIEYYKVTVVEDPKHPGVWGNLSKRLAAKKLGIAPKTLREWLQKEEKIRGTRTQSRLIGGGGQPSWPEMESRLFVEFTACRSRGRGINKAWFLRTAKRIFCDLYPDLVTTSEDGTKTYTSKFSKGWFKRFTHRWRVSWRAKTKVATKSPLEARPMVEKWTRFNRRNTQIRDGESPADVGRFWLCNMYNMDQTPLPFEFLEGKTYDFKGNKTVWVKTIRGGWHKRQATLMITVCGDGKRRLDPLIIFRGEGQTKAMLVERKLYHPGVRVEFNKKAYSNEDVTLRWIHNDLKWATDYDHNEPRFIALDVFKAQKTLRVLKALKKLNFVTSFIPEGCTSYVQPLDTHLNKVFKNKISEYLDMEIDREPEKWEGDNFCVGDRRVLITHCVGKAWEWLHAEQQDMIIRSFRQVGITLNVDGTEDEELRVKDLPDLTIGDWRRGGIDCNLDRDGKTGDGLLDLDVEDDLMFNYDLGVGQDTDDEEEGEYILENNPRSLGIIREWATRVTEWEAHEGAVLEDHGARTRAIMDVDFLCTASSN